ncbi:DUF4157 domain-containing protein [Nostoc sp. LEGE 06077]|nr:DUF4157 domain-containing protein [Nostoc sp. LEGE 06077]
MPEFAIFNPAGEQSPVQAKLAIGAPGDKYEQSADQTPTHILQRINTTAQHVNHTGLPDNLKTGIENLSGLAMDDVRVHYNSPKPAELNALAYAQGTEIHVASGQEQHLPHEAWHIVQQKQGRVKPTIQRAGIAINDDHRLEREADTIGQKALQIKSTLQKTNHQNDNHHPVKVVQAQSTQVIQLATNPVGNFAAYDAANLNVIAQNTTNNPTDVEVLNSGTLGTISNPPSPGGFADLTQGYEDMGGLDYPPHHTRIRFDLNYDLAQGNNYTRMHAVNSFLAQGSNVSANIFSGRQSYNGEHTDRVESFAKGYVKFQSWRVKAGNTLANTLNSTDQIGKNGTGQLYYKPSVANTFPAAFVNNAVAITGNDTSLYDGINEFKFRFVNLVEYRVQPIYGLNLATVINSIHNSVDNLYQNLNLHPNTNGVPGGTHTETIPTGPGSTLHTAASALVNTYATEIQVDMILWNFNPAAILSGSDVATDAVPWQSAVIPPVSIDPPFPEPGASVQFNYININNKRVTSCPGPFAV